MTKLEGQSLIIHAKNKHEGKAILEFKKKCLENGETYSRRLLLLIKDYIGVVN